MNDKMTDKITHNQWFKYKFGGPGGLKKIGALLSVEGVLGNLLVPLTPVWSQGTFASNFMGPETAFPRVPLTLTTADKCGLNIVSK